MRIKASAHGVCVFGVVLLLSACGGGGDGANSSTPPTGGSPLPGSSQPPNPTTGVGSGLSLAANTVTFSTSNRNFTPDFKSIGAKLDYTGAGTLYFKMDITGDGLTGVFEHVTDGRGQIDIVPSRAGGLNPGSYAVAVKISVCIDDPECANNRLLGSPQTVNVNYTITSAVQGDVVSPSVVPALHPGALAGTLTGTVILRGRGLSSTTSVQFGSAAATAVTVVSDSEVRVTYPTLEAGTYPIALNGGAIPFSGQLTAIVAPGFPRTTLAYPSRPQEIVGMVYDARRASVFVAARYSQSAGNQLIKFSYNGSSWSAPVSLTIADIRDVALSPDGSTLLVATDKSIIELNPETLTSLGTYVPADSSITSGSVRLHQLASANDGYVVVVTAGTTGTPIYLYSATDHTFQSADFGTVGGNVGANSTGSFIAIAEAQLPEPSSTAVYEASTQLIELKGRSVPNKDESAGVRSARPAIDRAGQLIAFNGATTPVYTSGFGIYQHGSLPSTTRAVAYNFDSTRAYTFDIQASGEGSLRAFDTSRPTAREYRDVTVGSTPVTLEPGLSAVFMATTPNGQQTFVAGVSGVVVENTP